MMELTLLQKLDDHFLKDKDSAAFEALSTFQHYQHPHKMSIIDYINTIKCSYQKAEQYQLELPDEFRHKDTFKLQTCQIVKNNLLLQHFQH